MSTASRTVMTALVLCSLAACADSAQPQEVSRGLGDGPGAGAVAHKTPARGPLLRDPSAPPSNRVLLKAPPPAPPIVVTEREERPAEGVLTARDYAGELRRMLGDPSPCLGPADRGLGRNVAFQVDVDVQSSGRVVEARVSSPDVSPDAIACLRDAALRARFEQFTDGTRHVQTAVVLHLRAPE